MKTKEKKKRIMMQISSGQGPAECELAVLKLFEALRLEFPDIELIDKSPGRQPGCNKSIRFYGNKTMCELDGSVQWICESPFRPNHKRKNWFIDLSICSESDDTALDESQIRYETFRSSGKGGQHVNKTDSGVRATYEPTGDSVVVMDERSQHSNKKIAVNRLRQLIKDKNQSNQGSAKAQNWLENYRIVRGNPVRVYVGMDFKLKQQ